MFSLISFFKDLKFVSSGLSLAWLELSQFLYHSWLLWGYCFPDFFLRSFVFWKTTDFSEWIMYSTTLLKVFISCRISLNIFATFMWSITSSGNKDTWFFFFSNLYPLDLLQLSYFSILHRYGEREQSFLAFDFSGLALSFSPFKLMLAMGLL